MDVKFILTWISHVVMILGQNCGGTDSKDNNISNHNNHYNDVIIGTISSQITSLTIVYSTVYSDADQTKYQSSASLAFVRGIHRRPLNSPHKWPVTRKMFPFDDVIMICSISHELVTKGRVTGFLLNSWGPFPSGFTHEILPHSYESEDDTKVENINAIFSYFFKVLVLHLKNPHRSKVMVKKPHARNPPPRTSITMCKQINLMVSVQS